MAIDVGHTLDKYKLLERVGRGGMSVVYRARDTGLDRDVAVKVLHGHLAESKEARKRFEHEALAVAKLRHENILEIYDFSGADPEASYIVTEFIDGQTLAEFISGTDGEESANTTLESARPSLPLLPEIGALIACEICKALSHAHSEGIIHRDVKPENVMIRNDGRVKLMDFGIAQLVDRQRMTSTGQLLGSPAYMSPEHISGGKLDFRTDVFAAGTVLYQLATGALPFAGQNPHEVLKKIADATYTPATRQNPHVANALATIIHTALAKEKSNRFQTVDEMHDGLIAFLDPLGLENTREEVAVFFRDPKPYDTALRGKIVEKMTARGTQVTTQDKALALDCFSRVLVLDPKNPTVLKAVSGLASKHRVAKATKVAGLLLAFAIAAIVGLWIHRDGQTSASPPDEALTDLGNSFEDASRTQISEPNLSSNLKETADKPLANEGNSPQNNGDTVSPTSQIPSKDAKLDRVDSLAAKARGLGGKAASSRDRVTTPAPTAMRQLQLTATPRGSSFQIDAGPWKTAIATKTTVSVSKDAKTITVRNPSCCASETVSVPKGDILKPMSVHLDFLPATVTPRCPWPDVGVRIDGKLARIGRPTTIALKDTLGRRQVPVEFFSDRFFETKIEVKYKDSLEVRCE